MGPLCLEGVLRRGALTAIAFAADMDISSGTENLTSVGFAPEVACLFTPVFFSASAAGVAISSGPGVCSAAGAGFDLACQLKFPGSVFVLTFPGAGLALPRASLEVLEELPRSHLELALTRTRREQH